MKCMQKCQITAYENLKFSVFLNKVKKNIKICLTNKNTRIIMRHIKTRAPLVIQRRRFVFIYFIYQRMAGQGRLDYLIQAPFSLPDKFLL